MDKNVFAKNKKYNPDVLISHTKKKDERDITKYTHTEKFFNLGNNPSQDNSLSTQLSNNFNIDKPLSDLDKAIKQKLNERSNQEFNFKASNKNVIPTSNPNEFHQFNDLKNNKERIQDNSLKKSNENKHEEMLKNLKSLGILK